MQFTRPILCLPIMFVSAMLISTLAYSFHPSLPEWPWNSGCRTVEDCVTFPSEPDLYHLSFRTATGQHLNSYDSAYSGEGNVSAGPGHPGPDERFRLYNIDFGHFVDTNNSSFYSGLRYALQTRYGHWFRIDANGNLTAVGTSLNEHDSNAFFRIYAVNPDGSLRTGGSKIQLGDTVAIRANNGQFINCWDSTGNCTAGRSDAPYRDERFYLWSWTWWN